MRSVVLLAVVVVLLGFVPSSLEAGFAGTDVYLASVGRGPGAADSEWFTTVWIHNPNQVGVDLEISFLERSYSNPSPPSFFEYLPPGETVWLPNIVEDVFGLNESFGAIRITSNEGLLVSSRIYSVPGDGGWESSTGQLFSGIPSSFAIGAGESTELLGVFQLTPTDESPFRYNFGFVETAGGTVTVRVTALDGGGNPIGSPKSYTLGPSGALQKNLADVVPSPNVENVRLHLEVVSGSGRVIAFGSGVANESNDPSTFEMQFDDALLGGGSGGISSVAHDATLTGDGTSTAPLGLADAGVSAPKIGAINPPTDGDSLTYTPGGMQWRAVSGSGGGDITAVDSGPGLSGGGESGAVTLRVAADGINGSMLGDGSVGSSEIIDGSIGPQDLGNGSVRKSAIAASDGTDGQVLGWNGTNLVWQDDGISLPYNSETSNAVSPMFIRNNHAFGDGITSFVTGRGTGFVGGTITGIGIVGAVEAWTLRTGIGVYGAGNPDTAVGVRGDGQRGDGVWGHSYDSNRSGVYGTNNDGGYSGYFQGKVGITGALTKGGGAFKIDHPLDPENRYLYHSFVESPDMMNVYNGNAVMDARGEAWVELPEWFDALNRDYRYQLTCIGGFAPVFVAEEIVSNRFKIAGGSSGLKVSWQVTGIRHDPWAEANRVPIEEDKNGIERGSYVHPQVYGQPEDRGVSWVHRPGALEEERNARKLIRTIND